MYDLVQLRNVEFPESANQTYLNHAAIAPVPQRTVARVAYAVNALTRDPATFWNAEGTPTSAQLCAEVAELLHAASPEEIVPITNTGSALSAVARALPLVAGDNVLFAETEFPANAYPWMALARNGIEPRSVPAVDGGLTLETVERYADGRTRVVAASSVQFLSGQRTDLAAIGEFCREHNIIFIVDAIQSIGHMAFDVQAMNIDVLAAGGQKSLLALPGSGILYIRDDMCDQLQPWPISATATADYLHWLDYDMTPLPGAARFSSGTPNLPGLFGLQASVGLIRELGPENIDVHTTALSRRVHESLTELGYRVITPYESLGPIVTFSTGRDVVATDALIAELAAERLLVGRHLDAPGNAYVRVSVHCYNTIDDIDRLMDRLPRH